MTSNQQLITNAGNTEFWKQVQKEISEFTCPVFLCTHSATFGTNWKNIVFIKEVHILANKFLDKYTSCYNITVNTIINTNEGLFHITAKHNEPIPSINTVEVRIKFLEWVINYLTTNQAN